MEYRNLGIMTILSFISMYILMYSMVDQYANVYNNFNQLYMALVMTAPMVLIELFVMRKMYKNKRLNTFIAASSFVILVSAFLFIRKQTFIDDKQFLKSMIPHHASAILMCKKVSLQDPEIEKLCDDIIKGQQFEITFMKSKLEEMK